VCYDMHCYYCDNLKETDDLQEYLKHSVNKHPGKPAYPGIADIISLELTEQGMKWEI
jgi:hypothetical protein